jgi:ABC-type microcin C transport system duplicated ATPase subunit YejF
VSALLEVVDLCIDDTLDELSYSVEPRRTVAIVGPGSSPAARAIIGLAPGRLSGQINFDGRDLLGLRPAELRGLRGSEIGMIFPDPLHPFLTVAQQVTEAILVHRRVRVEAARDIAIDLIEATGIPDPHLRIDHYPHQLSAAMRGRAALAIALANEPKLLIADEPTPELLDVIAEAQRQTGMAVVISTRDVTVARHATDNVVYSAVPSSST